MDKKHELNDEELESVTGGTDLHDTYNKWGSCKECLAKIPLDSLNRYGGLCRTCANKWKFE